MVVSVVGVLMGLFSMVVAQSSSCGDLISPDGWRYDLMPLQNAGPQRINYPSSNGTKTFVYAICGLSQNTKCGNCERPGVCLLQSDTCYGSFSYTFLDPLLLGIGVQIRYYSGDLGSSNYQRITYFTIFCDQNAAVDFSDVQVDNLEPLISIKIKSKAGCPAHGGSPPSFPFQYRFKKYIYTNDPKNGITEPYHVLDAITGKKRIGSTVLDSSRDVKKVFYWGDSDQYHKLSCYYLQTDEIAIPFQLPDDSIFLGTTNFSFYDPNMGKFKDIITDQWEYSIDGTCITRIWFQSGKAIPVQQISCTGQTEVFFDFILGQPDGSLLTNPSVCYPFQTCGNSWNTCKYPYCCNSEYYCTLCD